LIVSPVGIGPTVDSEITGAMFGRTSQFNNLRNHVLRTLVISPTTRQKQKKENHENTLSHYNIAEISQKIKCFQKKIPKTPHGADFEKIMPFGAENAV
jgi:hypothetical protein